MVNNDNNYNSSGSKTNRVGRRTFLAAAGAGAVTTTFAGCLGGIGGDDEGFKIGHLAPTGMSMGRGSERSALLAEQELNDDGGILDEDVEVIAEDTETSVSNTTQIVETLVERDNVDLLVGTFSSEVTQGIIDTVAEFGVPFIITGSADSSTLQDTVAKDYKKYKNVFRTGPINSELQAEAMADYAEFLSDEHGWNSFAHLSEDAAWTVPFQNLLPDELESRGLDVVYDETASVGTENFTPFLDEIEDAGADALIRFFASGGRGQMIGAWVQGEYDFAVEGTHVASMSPEFWDQTNGACIYETTAQSGAGGVAELTDETMDFVEAYEDEYADEEPPSKPMYMGFNTYDAIHFYSEVADEAGTVNYEDDLDDIVDAMLSTEMTGTAGEISLYGQDSDYPNDAQEERNDDDKISNYPVTQWQPQDEDAESGAHQCVFPDQNATADHMAPHWMS